MAMSPTPSGNEWEPAMKPPPGMTSNFVDPPSQGYVTIIVMVISLSLATPLVLIRMYTRHFINQRLWWDDYTSVISWIGLLGSASILFESLKYGSGVHLWNVSVEKEAHFTKLWGNLQIVARISMFFTKFSILLLFLRIFVPPPTQKNKIYYTVWSVIWLNLLFCIALVLALLLQCVGKKGVPMSSCINMHWILTVAALINSLSDIVMLLIPVAGVWRLQMPIKRKFELLVVFGTGMLAVAVSIARLGWHIQQDQNPDRTIVLMNLGLLAVSEQTIGIIVGCMPVLPAFFSQFRRQNSRSRSSNSRAEDWGKWREYKEIYGLEKRHKPGVEISGTITKADGGCGEISIPEKTIQGLHGSPETDVLVSRSVQVESHLREMEESPILPQLSSEASYSFSEGLKRGKD